MKSKFPHNHPAAALLARESLANTLRRIENASFEAPFTPADLDRHERITEFNAALATEAYFQQPLTDYAVGFREPDLDRELEFFAPEVPVGNRFEYATFSSAEEFLSDNTDDERAIRSDFKEVEYTDNKVHDKVRNRGLQIVLDVDQIKDRPNWEEYYTEKLLRRLKRNSLRRAVALLSAAATDTAKTWDATAGKDPDQDVLADLVTCADASGIMPNRVGYGATAASKRALAHRAQNSAGGFASAGLNEELLAAFLGVDEVLFSKARYTTGASTKAQTVGNLVLMFNAMSGMDTEDASNIKRFYANGGAEEGGGRYQVYSQRVSSKRHIIAIGHYELTRITSTLGIRKFTVS